MNTFVIATRKEDTATLESSAERTPKDTKQKHKYTQTLSNVEPCLASSSSSVHGSNLAKSVEDALEIVTQKATIALLRIALLHLLIIAPHS